MAQNTALMELIEIIKEMKNNSLQSYKSSDVQSSEKLQAMYEGINMSYGIAIMKATELLPKERNDIENSFNSGKGNVFGKTCFLIKDGTEYFDKTFNHQ